MSKFKYPVSMVVTKEQFEADLRKPLEDLGYSIASVSSFTDYPLLFVRGESINNIDFTIVFTSERNSSTFIDHYNPELLIALASMREGDEPHVGEWFKVLKDWKDEGVSWRKGELIKVTSINDHSPVGKGVLCSGYDRDYYTKASKEDIILHFTKNKTTMKGELIGYKLIKPEYTEAACKIEGYNFIGEHIRDGKTILIKSEHGSDRSKGFEKLHRAGVLDLWFSPVYQEQERFLTVNCDQGQFSVKRTEDGYEFEGKVISLPYLKALRNKMNGYDTVNGWNIAFAHVSIGCKSGISIMELQKLIDQYGK